MTAYCTSRELIESQRHAMPEVLVVDLDHAREDTMTVVRASRAALPDAHLVLLGTARRQGAAASTADAEVETPIADLARLVASLGRSGRAPRPSTEVLSQRRLWARVTPRQREVLRWLATGEDNRSIARRLDIGERAVKAHVSTLMRSLEVDNRTQLALLACEAGVRPRPARTSLQASG